MNLPQELLENIVDYYSIITIVNHTFLNNYVKYIKIKRLFNEFKTMNYIEDFFKYMGNDENCIKVLKKINKDEFLTYINDDTDYEDKNHIQSGQECIIYELYDLKFIKSLFYLFENKFINWLPEYDIFKYYFNNDDKENIIYLFENYINKFNKNIEIRYFKNHSKKQFNIMFYLIKHYKERIYFNKEYIRNIIFEIKKDIQYKNLFKYICKTKRNNLNSYNCYNSLILINNIELMNFSYDECGIIPPDYYLYNNASENHELWEWLTKHKVKKTKIQRKLGREKYAKILS